MAIEFHCDHCGKMVKAPDEAGGKRGKCPGCHQSVYVPTPSDQIELIDIAPIDETEERKRAELLKESQDVQRRLRNEKEAPAPAAGATPASGAMPIPKLDMETLIVEYALAMANGNLEQAEHYAADIHSDMDAANEVMQRLTADDIPPEQLAKIPRPVLVGFFRQLQQKG